jgi:hypothetical protein
MHKGIVAVLVALSCTAAGACEQRAAVAGHWEWQGNGHVWVPAHETLPPAAYAWREGAPPSPVREVAHNGDQRDAREQPRDLDRRFTR